MIHSSMPRLSQRTNHRCMACLLWLRMITYSTAQHSVGIRQLMQLYKHDHSMYQHSHSFLVQVNDRRNNHQRLSSNPFTLSSQSTSSIQSHFNISLNSISLPCLSRISVQCNCVLHCVLLCLLLLSLL